MYLKTVRRDVSRRATIPGEFPEIDQSKFPFPHEKWINEDFVAYTSLFESLFHNDVLSYIYLAVIIRLKVKKKHWLCEKNGWEMDQTI